MRELATYLEGAAGRVADAILSSIYQYESLDAILVASYFAVMAALCSYGLHRYWLMRLYYRNRRKALAAPARRFERLPAVTVQLPVYNERFVVEQLIEAVCNLDYPRDRLEIQVLDDSTDETCQAAQAAVRRMAAQGHSIQYIHRDRRVGFKAGALKEGMARARGELFAIFDADFLPAPDFLQRTVHYFTDPQVGLVQARWTYRNRQQSLLTKVQAMLLDGHFVFEQGGRSRSGCFFNFNGTAGVLRRQMIEDAGGWELDTLTEDTDLSYRAQLKGWKFLYAPHIEVLSELPTDMVSFQVQQARWAKGLIQTGIKLLPAVLRADLPWKVKSEAWFHLTANLSYPLMIPLSVLMVPALLVRLDQWRDRFFFLDLPLFAGTFVSLSVFYVLSQRELFPDWKRRVLYLPMLLAVGVGLTLTNAKAVLEALAGIGSPFERTAKYSADQRSALLARRKYRRGLGWSPLAHLAAAVYFGLATLLAAFVDAWPMTPFLLLFTVGYGFAGGLMLAQGLEQRLAAPEIETLGLRESRARSPAVPT